MSSGGSSPWKCTNCGAHFRVAFGDLQRVAREHARDCAGIEHCGGGRLGYVELVPMSSAHERSDAGLGPLAQVIDLALARTRALTRGRTR